MGSQILVYGRLLVPEIRLGARCFLPYCLSARGTARGPGAGCGGPSPHQPHHTAPTGWRGGWVGRKVTANAKFDSISHLICSACTRAEWNEFGSQNKRQSRAQLTGVVSSTRRKHEVALGVPLRADALALRPRGARSSPSRHRPVCLGESGADSLLCCH